jgi:hypothetical protein
MQRRPQRLLVPIVAVLAIAGASALWLYTPGISDGDKFASIVVTKAEAPARVMPPPEVAPLPAESTAMRAATPPAAKDEKVGPAVIIVSSQTEEPPREPLRSLVQETATDPHQANPLAALVVPPPGTVPKPSKSVQAKAKLEQPAKTKQAMEATQARIGQRAATATKNIADKDKPKVSNTESSPAWNETATASTPVDQAAKQRDVDIITAIVKGK